MRYRFIEAHRETHSVEKMAALLDVSRSGHYAWRGRPESHRRCQERQLVERTEAIQKRVKFRYGSPRITQELARHGQPVGHNRVARLLAAHATRGAKPRKRYRVTTKSDHALAVAEEPAGEAIQRTAAQPGLGQRHHLPADRRRLAVLGGGAGPVRAKSGRLGAQYLVGRGAGRAGVPHGLPASAPCRGPEELRKPPEIFCFTLVMRRSRSVRLLSKGIERSRIKASTACSCSRRRRSRLLRALLCRSGPRCPSRRTGGGLARNPMARSWR